MKTILKITLLASAAGLAVTLPVSAADELSGLRGMFSPQSAVAEFKSRYAAPQSQAGAWQQETWQQRRLQAQQSYTQPTHATHYAQSSYTQHRQAEPNVRYYTAEEYYGRNQLTGQLAPKAAKRPRFGFGDIYDFESGRCGKACAAPAPVRVYSPRPTYYAPAVRQQPVRQLAGYRCWNGEIVQDKNGCERQTISQTIPQYRCWDGEVVTDKNGCKRQTITREVVRQVNPSPVSSSPTRSTSFNSASTPVNCPSGTSIQADGTCLQFSSTPTSSFDSGSSFSSSSSSSYGSGSSFSGGIPTNCPSGTIAQTDGTCLESGGSTDFSNPFTGSSVEIFSGNETSSTPSYGYQSDGSYGITDYPPIRK